MSGQFSGKVALVIGGNVGIGKATAFAFARAGAKVAIGARREGLGNEIVAQIKAEGGDAIFIRADVSKASDAEALVGTTVETYGRLDCAFNNAASSTARGKKGRRVADATEKDWDDVMNTNLKGIWRCMKYEIPEMMKAGVGAIVNNSSVSGHGGYDGGSLYVASKHGVSGLTKCAAVEYAKQGIRVNAVEPGIIETHIWGAVTLDRRTKLNQLQPIPRMGQPEEVADTVLWLCSEQSSYVTGVTLLVDGGMCARP